MTPLDPRARHFADRVEVSARALGEPLIPWQRRLAELATAVDPDDPTRWRYPLVTVTVPRQSGKSTGLRALHLDRLIKPLPTGRRQQPTTLWMTAQTGKAARARFADLVDRATTAPALKPILRVRRSVGSEALQLGTCQLSPFAPTPSALHGETTPFVSVDEAWAFDEAQAATLLAAITPTMQNIAGSQLVVISTAGTRKSRWLWDLVTAGRASVTDPSSRMGYIELAADDRYAEGGDGDPLDPAALNFHPAIGSGLTTAQDVMSLYPSAGGIENIRRGFLNLWPADMDAAGRDLDDFDHATVATPPEPTGPISVAFDVAADRSGAAIFVAFRAGDRIHVELADSRPGVAWLPTALAKITSTSIHYDPTGYTGAAVAGMTLANLKPVGVAQLADAAAQFIAGLSEGSITLHGTDLLRDQYRDANTKPAAGTGFVFDPKTPTPIDHLRAAALAHHAANRHVTTPAITF